MEIPYSGTGVLRAVPVTKVDLAISAEYTDCLCLLVQIVPKPISIRLLTPLSQNEKLELLGHVNISYRSSGSQSCLLLSPREGLGSYEILLQD